MNSSEPPFSPSPRHPDSINPVLISIIGALGSIFLVVGYYQLLLRYCACFEHVMHGRLGTNQDGSGSDDEVTGTGLDSSLVARIPIVKYRAANTDSGNECSVCLTEFSEGVLVRVLPKCSHAFHISCIGLWLNTRSNCPLCRANIALSLAEYLSPKKVEEIVSPTATGQVIEPRRSPASVNVVERPLPRSFSYGDSSQLPPEGASSSQWYQRFRWSARTSSPSREDQMRSRLLDIEGKGDLEVGINFDPTVGVSNGGNHSSTATKMECL